MRYLAICGLVLVIAMPAVAQTPTLKISLGVREPSAVPNPITAGVGAFHNTNPAGGIEWFNKDQQTLVLDGTWQQFTFDLSAAGISATSFTGDGLISADKALLEHLRMMRPAGAGATAVEMWIDKVQMTYDPTGLPPPTTVTCSTFDGANNGGVPYTAGAKVMFRDPSFSGSTSSMINQAPGVPNVTGIDITTGVDDSYSVKAQWKWLYTNAVYKDSPWLRLTPYYTTTWAEVIPVVAEAGGPSNSYASASVSVWLKGVPEPASLSLLALGGLALLRRR